MKVDAPLPDDLPLHDVTKEAQRLENLGFDGLWTSETRHDPFFPLLLAALGTERISLGTNIAIAFARSPFSTAMTAWDLQRASRGRLLLGLGTQVRAHIERRFSMPFEHPAARVTDYIECLRAIWGTFQTGAKPTYEGRFYRFKLINDFFNPGPIDHPDVRVYLAGVNPRMSRAAGEVADGFNIHPMHSAGYLCDVIRPAIDEGARTRGKAVADIELVADTFVVRGETEKVRSRSEAAVRNQVAFYASTPSYRTFLEYHGYPDTGKRLSALMREGRIAEMPKLVSDDLLSQVAVSEADGDLATLIRERYKGDLVQRVTPYESVAQETPEAEWRRFIERVRS